MRNCGARSGRVVAALLAKFDRKTNLKPWTILRSLDFRDPEVDIGLRTRAESAGLVHGRTASRSRSSRAVSRSVPVAVPRGGGAISPHANLRGSSPDEAGPVFRADHGAHVLVCGMNVRTTANRRGSTRVQPEALAGPRTMHYLKG
jgi:hypothetical protein